MSKFEPEKMSLDDWRELIRETVKRLWAVAAACQAGEYRHDKTGILIAIAMENLRQFNQVVNIGDDDGKTIPIVRRPDADLELAFNLLKQLFQHDPNNRTYHDAAVMAGVLTWAMGGEFLPLDGLLADLKKTNNFRQN